MEAYRKQLIEKTQNFFSELRDQLKGHESLRELPIDYCDDWYEKGYVNIIFPDKSIGISFIEYSRPDYGYGPDMMDTLGFRQVTGDDGEVRDDLLHDTSEKFSKYDVNGIVKHILLCYDSLYLIRNNADIKVAAIAWINPETRAAAELIYGHPNNWNVEKVTDMSYLFQDYIGPDLDLSKWDVKYVSTMQCMFHNAKSFNSDLRNWDISRLVNTRSMFNGASLFIINPEWNLENIIKKKRQNMFKNCGVLKVE